MQTLLYIVWWSIPAFFFLMALWGKLESVNKKAQHEIHRDFFMQGIFVSCCVILSMLLDAYLLPWLATDVFMDWLPLGFWQVILLPLVLLVGAHVVGGSEQIRILRAPRPTERKKK